MRSRLALGLAGFVAGLLSGLTGGCAVPAVFQPDEPTRMAGEPLPQSTVAVPELGKPPPPPRPVERLLWRGAVPTERLRFDPATGLAWTHHVASLIGVDPNNTRAYFMRSPSGNEDFFEVVDVSLSAEEPDTAPRSRWIGSRDLKYGALRGYDKDDQANLLRFAAIVEEVGPWVTRTRGGQGGPQVAVAKDALFFEMNPDEMHVANRDGTRRRKLVNAAAAYDPQVSGDGKTMAFRGCHYVSQVPKKLTRCEYHLYIFGSGDAKPARIADVIDPESPIFSADGRYVYTVTRDSNYLEQPYDRGGCLVRVETAAPHAATKLWCTAAHSNVWLWPDPTARTVAVGAKRLDSATYVLDVLWFDMPSGKLRNQVAIETGGGHGALSEQGLFMTSVRGGFACADLATGQVALLPRRTTDFTWLSQHWADATSVYAMRQRHGKGSLEEVVALDLRAALDAAIAAEPTKR